MPVGTWFNKKRNEFTRQWTALLQEQKTEIISQKLRYLSELADTPQPLHWASSYSNQSKNLNEAIETMDDTLSFNADDYAAWQKLKHQLEIRKLPSDAICLLNDALSKIKYGNTLSPESFTKLSIELHCMDDHHKDTFKTYHPAYSEQILSCLRQQLTQLEWAINNQSDLPDTYLINQTLDLLCRIDDAAETNSDLSYCYQILHSIFTNFKMLSKELTPQDIQQESIKKITELLSRLAYSNKEWKELKKLIDDAQTYQKDILEGRTPMTFEEIEVIEKENNKSVAEASQKHKDFMASTRNFLEGIKERRIAREQHGFLAPRTSDDCAIKIDYTVNSNLNHN